MEERLGIIWSLVLLQGGILVVSTLESLVANATQGFALIAISIVTGMAVVLALMSARGLRRQKRWARRLTLVAEWFVLTLGSMELVATQLLDSTGPDIVPVLTGIVVPSVVLLLLRSTKPLFKRNEPSAEIEVLV
jgi:hypothetical protein